jgi:hypothetical protein
VVPDLIFFSRNTQRFDSAFWLFFKTRGNLPHSFKTCHPSRSTHQEPCNSNQDPWCCESKTSMMPSLGREIGRRWPIRVRCALQRAQYTDRSAVNEHNLRSLYVHIHFVNAGRSYLLYRAVVLSHAVISCTSMSLRTADERIAPAGWDIASSYAC